MKKISFLFLTVAFGMFLVFQCGKKANSHITKIRFAIWGDVEEVQILEKLKKKFEKENPNIKIVLEHTPIDSYRDKLLTEVAGSTGPDVAFMATSRFAGLVEKGLFLPLDKFIQNDNEISKKIFYKKMIEAFSVNGKLYVLPRDIAPGSCVYYDKELMDKAGIAYPKDSWTMEDFKEISKKLSQYDSDNKPIQFGFNTWIWENFVYMYGGRIVDNVFHPTKFLMTSKKSLKGLKFYHDLMYVSKAMPSPVLVANLGMDFTMAFSSKKIAMIGSGIWETPTLRKSCPFDWDIAMFPSYKNGVWGGGSGYGVVSGTKHPDIAWKVVKFFAGEPGEKALADAGLAQPAIRNLALSSFLNDKSTKPSNKMILDKSADYIVFDPMFNDWDEILQTIINPNLELYLYNKITLQQMKNKIDKLIQSKYRWLKIRE